MNLKGKTAVVTGASSGLGTAFARQLSAMGASLVVTARRTDRLERLAAEIKAAGGAEVNVLPMDLQESDAPGRLFSATEGAGRPVEVLINNAGFATHGSFIKTPYEKLRGQIFLNMSALTELSHLFANAMAGRGSGYMLNVASYAGHMPIPYYAVYAATKAYVNNFTEALHYELKDKGLNVCSLCPGSVSTEFWEVAEARPPLGDLLVFSADEVARKGLKALFKGKRASMPGISYKVSAYVSRVAPRGVVLGMAARMAGEE
jgi:short-subunit dehydrogenase